MRRDFLIFILATLFLPVVTFGQGTCDSTNTSITSKFRYLGNWDENGIPDYLETEGDIVSSALLDYVNEIAPEGEDLHESSPEYFSEEIQLNTVITKTTDVYLTYVHEGAGWKNVLGFYTYESGNPPLTVDDIDSLTFIFPNVSKETTLTPGDKVHLGKFEEGTVIGYFLLAKGWTGENACLNSDAHFVFTDKHLNTFTTPEFQQQTILLNYKQENKLLLGIEDIRRPGGDQDFNDAVFYLTSDPIGIDTTNVPEVATATIGGEFNLCEGEDASIMVEFTGTAPWSMVYTNGTDTFEVENITSPSFSINASTAGEYRLIEMHDALGKGISSGVANLNIVSPTASISTETNTICEGETFNLEIEVENPLEGSEAVITYTDGSNTLSVSTTEETILLTDLGVGTYQLVSIDNGICTTELNEALTVTANSKPFLSYWNLHCESIESAIIELLIEGGTAPYSIHYQFNGVSKELIANDNLISIELLENGVFELTGISDINCTGTFDDQEQSIDCIGFIQNAKINSLPTSCRDEEINLGLEITELIQIESITWTTNGSGTIQNASGINAIYVPGEGETGLVEFSVMVMVNGKPYSVSGTVDILELPDATFSYRPQAIFTSETVTFSANANNYDSYVWYVDETEIEGNEITYVFDEAGVYEVTLIVQNGECINEHTEEVEVLLKNALFVPNVFNPTASNPESRVVKVYGNNISEEGFSFRIFNRWGNELYTSNSFIDANSNGWNGVKASNNESQDLNSFSYILKGSFTDGTKINKTGTITLVK